MHKSIYLSCSLHHAYYSQITRQRAVLKALKIQIASVEAVVSRSDRALERLRRFHFVINHCFVSRFQNDCHKRYSRAEAGATGTLTTAFRDWFLRR